MTQPPDREPDLALRFWTEGDASFLRLDHAPGDRQLIAAVLRQIADTITGPAWRFEIGPN